MSEQEERVKEIFADLRVRVVELADEVAGIADEQDDAVRELSLRLSGLEHLCDTIRGVLGDVEVVSDLESHVSDLRSSVDDLETLVDRLSDLNAPAGVDGGEIDADDDGDGDE
jgi:hypothetical protein